MTESQQVSVQSKNESTIGNENNFQGISIALTIIALWFLSLVYLLSINIDNIPLVFTLPAILWQTFLYTGLFITAHDAMHGVVTPQNVKLNNFIGRLAVLLYALFPYDKLLKKHWQHHHNPASQSDPDFHNGKHKNFFAWYLHFMKGYWDWRQLIGLIIVFNSIKYILHVPETNLNLFWIIPSILSSVQLFFFGTYLPHKEPKGGYKNSHRAQSNHLPTFLSFITCYHFGYHQEHHECPHAPWWNLPAVYQSKKLQQSLS